MTPYVLSQRIMIFNFLATLQNHNGGLKTNSATYQTKGSSIKITDLPSKKSLD